MGAFLIVLGAVWLTMSVLFVFALAFAAKRPCPGLELSSGESAVKEIPVAAVKSVECRNIPHLTDEENVIPAT